MKGDAFVVGPLQCTTAGLLIREWDSRPVVHKADSYRV
jgi:hypothetical protein